MILVHDAARPLLPDEVIDRLIGALGEGYDGAVPVLPVTDTVKRVRDGVVDETLVRDELVTVQTPQAFIAAGPAGSARQRVGGLGLRLARRVERRAHQDGRGRRAPAEGDDAGRSRASRLVAVEVVVFDIGETLVDETRHVGSRRGKRRRAGVHADGRARRGRRARGAPR